MSSFVWVFVCLVILSTSVTFNVPGVTFTLFIDLTQDDPLIRLHLFEDKCVDTRISELGYAKIVPKVKEYDSSGEYLFTYDFYWLCDSSCLASSCTTAVEISIASPDPLTLSTSPDLSLEVDPIPFLTVDSSDPLLSYLAFSSSDCRKLAFDDSFTDVSFGTDFLRNSLGFAVLPLLENENYPDSALDVTCSEIASGAVTACNSSGGSCLGSSSAVFDDVQTRVVGCRDDASNSGKLRLFVDAYGGPASATEACSAVAGGAALCAESELDVAFVGSGSEVSCFVATGFGGGGSDVGLAPVGLSAEVETSYVGEEGVCRSDVSDPLCGGPASGRCVYDLELKTGVCVCHNADDVDDADSFCVKKDGPSVVAIALGVSLPLVFLGILVLGVVVVVCVFVRIRHGAGAAGGVEKEEQRLVETTGSVSSVSSQSRRKGTDDVDMSDEEADVLESSGSMMADVPTEMMFLKPSEIQIDTAADPIHEGRTTIYRGTFQSRDVAIKIFTKSGKEKSDDSSSSSSSSSDEDSALDDDLPELIEANRNYALGLANEATHMWGSFYDKQSIVLQDRKSFGLILDLCQQGSLLDVLTSGKIDAIDLARRKELARHMTFIVHRMHNSSGYLHRNLDATHFLLTDEVFGIRLTGLGCMTKLDEATSPIPEGIAVSSLHVAPEGAVSTASDMYSLCVILRQLFEGKVDVDLESPGTFGEDGSLDQVLGSETIEMIRRGLSREGSDRPGARELKVAFDLKKA